MTQSDDLARVAVPSCAGSTRHASVGRYVTAVLLLLGCWPVATVAGCGVAPAEGHTGLQVVASVGFLADMAQHVAGDRFRVTTLVPQGAEIHAFEPGPADLTMVAVSDLVVINGAGLEGPLEKTLRDVGGSFRVVVASAGLKPRDVRPDERRLVQAGEADPHFWLDPVLALTYIDNLCVAFSEADPAGAAVYRVNAEAYKDALRRLDAWIRRRLAAVPFGERLLVTDHESYGYFADAFGFRIVGAVNPSVSPESMPSAGHIAALVRTMRREGVRAVFVDAGENASLAGQVAREAGARLVVGLRDHSLTGPDGPASTYIAMMEYDAGLIAEALR
jgi:zinc/manganese transport system substrate-binding protein